MKKIGYIIIIILLIQPVNAQASALVDFSDASIKEIQTYVDENILNYETIIKVYIDRINHYNDVYSSIIHINESAIDEAKKLDKERFNKGKRSELHGIPILVKDNIDVKGMPTTAGAKGLENNIAIKDAPIIENLRNLGAIIIAKTNMDEFAFNASMSNSSYGNVANAYDLNKSSYGSSGGTASAVASDLAVIGIGTDTGTSIRGPSSANNLYGLRPTKDSLSNVGIIGFESTRDTAGPMGKTAMDTALLYQAMHQGNLNFETQNIDGIQIGIMKTKIKEAPHFIQTLINNKIKEMETLGIEFVDVPTLNLPYDFNADNFCYEFNEYIKGTEGPIKSLSDLVNTKEFISYVDSYVGQDCNFDNTNSKSHQTYLRKRESKINKTNQFFDQYNVDIILYPTLLEKIQDKSKYNYNQIKSYSYNIPPQTGFPAINIPAGFHEELPYGLELVAKENKDALLLSVAIKVDELNPSYTLPKISPPLYEPFENIEQLIKIINKSHQEPEYTQIQENITNLIEDYSDYANPNLLAESLINFYNSTEDYLKKQESYKKSQEVDIKNIKIGLISEALLLVLWAYLRFKQKKYNN